MNAWLDHAARVSRFAARLLQAPPPDFDPAAVDHALDAPTLARWLDTRAGDDPARLDRALRQVRNAAMLHLLVRDVNGLAGLDEVLRTVTALAEQCIAAAATRHARWLAEPFGQPLGERSGSVQELAVVAMGKLGGGELNVSSDIDLVFLYGEEGVTSGARSLSNHEYFARLGRRLIAALGAVTADGFVFRVDMRLRPWGDSGPLAASLDALEAYFLTQGREWERYAWLKARSLGGTLDAALQQLVTPFVYRRYLDYGLLDALRRLHAQIRAEVTRRERLHDIKLGPGGIRELEFVAQVFQLVRGGADAGLRERSTRGALARLGERGLLPAATQAALCAAYAFLRRLEHCLQYLDDQQTQLLPADAGDREMVATAMGFAGDWARLHEALDTHRAAVTHAFEAIFATPGSAAGLEDGAALWAGREAPERAQERLGRMGFAQPADTLARLNQLREGSAYRRLGASSQARFDALLPAVLETAAAQADPSTALERLLQVLESIGRREAYLALLQEFPAALARLGRITAGSAWASRLLCRHPILLDELVAPVPPELAPGPLRLLLRAQLERTAADDERQMELLREFKQAQTLRLLAQDLEGALTPEAVSDGLSALADVLLEQTLAACWASLPRRHRPAPAFAVVGYGKLGGRELGYASDLDLIFLHDDPDPEARDIYARLARRLNAWMGTQTSGGQLYQTDLRLRPDGAAGLLVSSVAAFAAYQHERAWPWEHQALTRARFVCGDPAVGTAFEALRRDILCQRREPGALRVAVTGMRERMADAHTAREDAFDLKHDRGGMVDVEFIVQYLVLAHAADHPALADNDGNIALLGLAGQLGLVPQVLAGQVQSSYRELRRLTHRRLLDDAEARIAPAQAQPLRAPVLALWSAVFGDQAR